MKEPIKSIFIDNSAITLMTEDGLWRLLAASKKGNLSIYFSEVVIWEKTKARYRLAEKSMFHAVDMGIPYDVISFKKTLKEFGVNIIEHDSEILKKAEEFIDNTEAAFDINISNELRDAHILATAFCKLDKSTLIMSNDKKLIDRIPILLHGFDSVFRDEIKDFVTNEGGKNPGINPCNREFIFEELRSPFSESLISVLPIIDPDDFEKLKNDLENINDSAKPEIIRSEPEEISSESDELEAFLSDISSVDNEIKKKVLGYTQWFSEPPISKNELYDLIKSDKYNESAVENNALRLKQENLLIETENYWLTNTADAEAVKICKQAMAVVMPEILGLMGLN